MNDIFLQIPSTTANLGPGFDLLGIALDIYNYIYVEFESDSHFEIYDFQNQLLPYSDLSKNLIFTSYENVFRNYKIKNFPQWKARVQMGVSPGKGLGSSATAIVAGVQIAKEVLKTMDIHLNLEKEIEFFLQIENHPDNVVPARIGGWVFCHNPQYIIKKTLPEDLGLCVIIPNYEISTEISRSKLKEYYTREEAISNMKGCLLWLEYIHSHNPEYLKIALALDRLHQPFRYPNIKYFKEIQEFISETQCLGMSLSGSGPGLIIYYEKNKEDLIKRETRTFFQKLNQKDPQVEYEIKFCNPDYEGTKIIKDQKQIENIIQNPYAKKIPII